MRQRALFVTSNAASRRNKMLLAELKVDIPRAAIAVATVSPFELDLDRYRHRAAQVNFVVVQTERVRLLASLENLSLLEAKWVLVICLKPLQA